MLVRMRNKATNEYRDVESDGPEMRELKNKVTQSGYPAWEVLRLPGDNVPRDEATYAELLDLEVCGEDQSFKDLLKHEALILDAQGVTLEDNPHVTLSPGEIDAGLTPEDKMRQIRSHYAPDVPTRDEILSVSSIAEVPRRVKKSKGLRAPSGVESGQPSQAAAVVAAASGGGDD